MSVLYIKTDGTFILHSKMVLCVARYINLELDVLCKVMFTVIKHI